jgi:hypothetical protein
MVTDVHAWVVFSVWLLLTTALIDWTFVVLGAVVIVVSVLDLLGQPSKPRVR